MKLTLLLINSQRVELTIDEEYLQRHDQTAPLSIQEFKQCLHADWNPDWGCAAPTTANNIRLIHLGKVLDEGTLDDYINSKHNVVHLSVKPESFELEEASQKSQTTQENVAF